MSRTREIAPEDLGRSLSELSRREANHPVHIEVIGSDIGDETLTRSLPLLGMSVETKGSDRGAVDLLVGRAGSSGMLDHRISDVTKVAVLESDDGAIECLDIETSAGKTLVRFD